MGMLGWLEKVGVGWRMNVVVVVVVVVVVADEAGNCSCYFVFCCCCCCCWHDAENFVARKQEAGVLSLPLPLPLPLPLLLLWRLWRRRKTREELS